MPTLRRPWLVLIGVFSLPGCGPHPGPAHAATTPAPAPRAESPAALEPRRRTPDLPVRTEPLEPGPIDMDVALPFRVGPVTSRESLSEDQWALFESWAARDPGAPRIRPHDEGRWDVEVGERPQPWTTSLRFFVMGGRMHEHDTWSGVRGILYRGWPLFLRVEPRRGALVACRADLWSGLADLKTSRRAEELDREAFLERRDALFRSHCLDLWPVLWEGLSSRARGEPLEQEVLAFVTFWEELGGGRARIVHPGEPLPDWARRPTAAPVPAPSPHPPTGSASPDAPEVTRTPGDGVRATGRLVHSYSMGAEALVQFSLEADASGCTVTKRELANRPAFVPY